MTRTEEREQAFVLIFEKEFNMDTSMDDIISYATEADVFSNRLLPLLLQRRYLKISTPLTPL